MGSEERELPSSSWFCFVKGDCCSWYNGDDIGHEMSHTYWNNIYQIDIDGSDVDVTGWRPGEDSHQGPVWPASPWAEKNSLNIGWKKELHYGLKKKTSSAISVPGKVIMVLHDTGWYWFAHVQKHINVSMQCPGWQELRKRRLTKSLDSDENFKPYLVKTR